MNLRLAIFVLSTFYVSIYCKPYRSHKSNTTPRRDHTHPWQDPMAYLYRPRYQTFNHNRPFASLTGRIVGGSNAFSGDVPYQLRLSLKLSETRTKFCGATLVYAFDLQFAVTAAHCVWDDTAKAVASPKNLGLIAGELNLNKVSGDEQYRTAVQIVIHKDWDIKSPDLTDDIALVFYVPAFEINSKVKIIELPGWMWDQPDELEVSGWGSTTDRFSPSRPDILKVVSLPTIDNGECNRRFGHYGSKITWQMICGLDRGFEVGACSGDSGGPAAAWNDSEARWYLAGISSFVKGEYGECGNGYDPTVFVRVSTYITWIWERVSEYL